MAVWSEITVPEDALRFSSDVFDVSDADFLIRFCEDVVKENPKHVDALILLGHAYTSRGEYEKGLEIDLQLVSLRPWDAVAFYNLACSYALTGATQDALQALRRAFHLGYRDVDNMLQDDDLASLRDHPEFRKLVREWRQRKEGAA